MTLDEHSLANRINILSTEQQSLFALSCADLMKSIIKTYAEHDIQSVLENTIESLWNNNPTLLDPLNIFLDRIETNSETDPYNTNNAYVENAIIATFYAIEICDNPNTQFAVWAARQITDAADHHESIRSLVTVYPNGTSATEKAVETAVEKCLQEVEHADNLINKERLRANIKMIGVSLSEHFT